MRFSVLRQKLRSSSIVSVGVLALAAGVAYAADLDTDGATDAANAPYAAPAVSGINGKVQAGYIFYNFDGGNTNNFDDGQAFSGIGAISLPVSHQFGLQIDAGFLSGSLDRTSGASDVDVTAVGVGGHFFWRDPSKGLIGIYGHYAGYEYDFGSNSVLGAVDVGNVRIAAEAELYHGQFTAKALAGLDVLDVDGLDDESFLLLAGELDYYINDNVRIYGGVEHSFDQTMGTLGAEALLEVGNVSPALYANASFGDDAATVMAGVNVYFGRQEKSLMERHREDDPGPDLFSIALASCLQGIGALETPNEDGLTVLTDPEANLDDCEFIEADAVENNAYAYEYGG